MMNRRMFLKSLTGLTVGMLLPPQTYAVTSSKSSDRLGDLLPTRVLGRTDQAVTMLGVGGWHIGRMSEREAQATIEAALEEGVRFFDTAESYQSGGSESRLGQLLTLKYRDVIYLMTKTTARDGAGAKRHLEDSTPIENRSSRLVAGTRRRKSRGCGWSNPAWRVRRHGRGEGVR